jgi:hypothetical protein
MADNMGGLLDFVQSPMGVGLLSAAFGGMAGARRGNGPLNTIGTAGLSGIAGYSAASANALKQQKAQMLQQQRQTIPTLYGKGADGSDTFDWKSAAALGLGPDEIAKFAQLPKAGMSKVARTVDVPGADGGKQTMQIDEYGQPVGQAINSYVAPQLVDLGNEKRFATPNAGQSFNVNLSPDQVLADQRARIGLGLQSQANAIAQDANNVNRMGQRTQIVPGADGKQYLVDKGTGQARLATTAEGAPVMSGQAAEDTSKRIRDANDSVELIGIARQTLPGATGSGIGAAADSTGRFFGVSTDGAQKAAQLEALGGALVMKMPRMEGPQSNLDQLLYREMAGKIGDRTVPIAEREAALQTVEQLLGKYATNRQQQASPAPRQAPQAGAFADPDKEARYQEFKRRQGQ